MAAAVSDGVRVGALGRAQGLLEAGRERGPAEGSLSGCPLLTVVPAFSPHSAWLAVPLDLRNRAVRSAWIAHPYTPIPDASRHACTFRQGSDQCRSLDADRQSLSFCRNLPLPTSICRFMGRPTPVSWITTDPEEQERLLVWNQQVGHRACAGEQWCQE